MAHADDNIKAVLVKAANDPQFFRRLLKERETALKDFPLAEHERTMLLAVPDEQLIKMVDEARRRPWYAYGYPSSPLVKVAVGGAVVAALLGIVIPSHLRGIEREAAYEAEARAVLQEIANAEMHYKIGYGNYGTLKDIRKNAEILEVLARENFPYTFEIKVAGDTFTATARHKTRPDTRKNFVVGPDGVVKTLDSQEALPNNK